MQDAQTHGLITLSVYRRNSEIVQIETRHAAIDPGYLLICRHADGTIDTETFDTSVRFYDRIRSLVRTLSSEGWILMPRERRGVNRLSVPLCSACSSSEGVEVLARTDADVRFGCARCGALWRVPKPGGLLPR
jgi:hypothetical protein